MSEIREILGKILDALTSKPMMEFPEGKVPVAVAAKVYGKDADWVRAGIVAGWLPIGYATRDGKPVTKIEDMNSKHGTISYTIQPKKLYEDTGYLWKGKEI